MTLNPNLRRFFSEFAENKVALVAAIIVLAIVLLALLAPLVAPQDPMTSPA
ncbi:hypothetical protein ACFQU7_21760 [Pseudoroseomonas wenyumeiae]